MFLLIYYVPIIALPMISSGYGPNSSVKRTKSTELYVFLLIYYVSIILLPMISSGYGPNSSVKPTKSTELYIAVFRKHANPRREGDEVDSTVIMETLMSDYGKMKTRIRKRLLEFKQVWQEPDEKIFEEMAFCLCTPQSSATSCFSAVEALAKSRVLFKGNETAIGRILRSKVRFHNTKSRYILGARQTFSDRSGRLGIKDMLRRRSPFALREWLVKNINGLGYKEAGHFLRNIGMGDDIAILDRHILRKMVSYDIIKEVPKTLSKKKYLDLEERLRGFSRQIGIPMAELDLLFWSQGTGEIFK